MADISKIKLPDGVTYNIKDATARGYVTGVKGNAESSYRTGQVNLTAANVGAIPSNTAGNTQNLSRPTGLRGLNDVTLQPLINTTRANRLAFLPADQIIIEKTTDGGTTWVDAGINDATKVGLFSETRAGVNLPLLNGVRSTLCGIRVTISAMKYNVPSGTSETQKYSYWSSTYVRAQERYCQLKEFYFWLSASNDSIGIKIERATGANPNSWSTTFNDSAFYMTGWSGCDYVKLDWQSTFGGGTTQTGNHWNYRLTFMTRGVNGTDTMGTGYETQSQSIMEIRGYGDTWWGRPNEYMANDKLYTHDYLQNVTFPNKVTATGGFSGALTGTINTSNNTWNKVGDDAQFGDINEAGTIGIQGTNGNTGLRFTTYNQSTKTAGGKILWDGTKFSMTGTVDTNISGTASNVTGTVAVANGGTGQTTSQNAANAFMNALSTGSSTPVDADYYISQYVNGGTTTTTYHRRPMSALWDYIKGKISSVLGLTVTNYGGTSAKATADASGNTITSTYLTKAAGVTGVAWDSTNKKLTKTINGSTTDVVTAATLRTGLNVADGAEVNQNAFSNVKVGSTTVAADSKTDTLELVAGSNVTLTPDSTNDKVTIAATDTTYESKSAASGGTAVSLVTTGEKYTWNNKSTVPTNHASSATTYGAGTSSNYGHLKLSDSTSSTSGTSGGIAATPSAVKTAYDLANTANGTANTALSGVNGTLIYDHTYTITNGVAKFVPHVYLKGTEVTSNYAASCFTWKYRLSNNVTSGTPTYVNLTTDSSTKGCSVSISTLGYGGYVLGTFTPPA